MDKNNKNYKYLNVLIGGGGFIGTHLQKYILSLQNNQENQKSQTEKIFKNLVIDKKFNQKISDDYNEYLNFDITKNNILYKIKDFIFGNVIKINIFLMASILGPSRVINNENYFQEEIEIENSQINFINELITFIESNILNIEINITYFSTSEVYGDVQYMNEEEGSYIKSIEKNFERQRYLIAKIYSEYYLTELYKNHKKNEKLKINFKIVRPFNVIGEDQDDIFVIPSMVKNALTKNEIIIYGDGTQTRTFIDVLDFCPIAFELTHNSYKYNDLIYNIAHVANYFNINEIAEKIKILVEDKNNKNIEIKRINVDKNLIGQFRRIPTNTRIFDFYRPQYHINSTLKRIINYYNNMESDIQK